MKKTITKVFIVLALLSGFHKVSAQQLVSMYGFSTTPSVPYVAIANGTVLGSNANDDDIFDNVNIGFTFKYNGVNFNELSVSANGYIKFGIGLVNDSYFPISNSFADDTIVSVLGGDLQSNAAGELMCKTTGNSPNRVFTAQWTDYTSYGNLDTMSFQIQLFETSNRIEFNYGHFFIDVNNTFQVGLRGNSVTDFNNRSVVKGTNTWSTSALGTVATSDCELDPTAPQFAPLNGLKYVWTAPLLCTGAPTAGSTTVNSPMACAGQTLNLNILGSTSALGLTYQWQSSPNGTTWSSVNSATNMAYATTFSNSIYYRCIVGCTTNTAASVPVQIIPQTQIVYATTPFLENFDNNWQNRCDVRNVPVSANWSSNPTTGNNSWRRQDDGAAATWSFSTGGVVTPFDGAGSADFHSYGSPTATTGQMDLYINLGGSSAYQLSFYHINETGDDSLEVLLSTNGGSTFTKYASFLSGDYSTVDAAWNKKIVSLGTVNSTSCIVRFKATADYGNDDIGIDSLNIKSTCLAPNLVITAPQSTICSGSSLNITASGANTYTWSTSATTSSISVTPTTTTTYSVAGSNSVGCTGNSAITIGVILCTGLNNNQVVNNNVSVYPNPTQGNVIVEFANGLNKTIQVLDISGRLVMETITKSDKHEFNLNNLSSGIYYVRVKSGDINETTKIIKQ